MAEDRNQYLSDFAAWYISLGRNKLISDKQCKQLWGFFNGFLGRNERPICDCSTCVMGCVNTLKRYCKINHINTDWRKK